MISNGRWFVFMEHDIQKAENLKMIMWAFEQVSGLMINFHNSEIFCFGRAKEVEQQYPSLFGCQADDYPFKYLGILMHFMVLIESALTNVALFMLSFF